MAAASVIFAISLLVMAAAQDKWLLLLSWVGIGIGSAMGLYEAAFATVVRLYGMSARNAITGITLIGGFTGTVSWPLSTFLEAHLGWRWACVVWAAINVLICLPLHLSLPRDDRAQPDSAAAPAKSPPPAAPACSATPSGMSVRLNDPRVLLLSFLFACMGIVATAMASQLPGVLMASGVSAGTALWISMLVGPTQVLARILDMRYMSNRSPMWATWLSTGLHPMGALCMLVLGPPAALAFGLIHGVGNGLLTIARGALPLAIFGPNGYGQLQGWLMAPGRIIQSFTPWLFGMALVSWGGQALWITVGVSVLGLLALCWLQRHMRASTSEVARA